MVAAGKSNSSSEKYIFWAPASVMDDSWNQQPKPED